MNKIDRQHEALKARAEKRKRMRAMCKDYVQQPIFEMDGQETRRFACRLATKATISLRIKDAGSARQMTTTEAGQYAAAVAGAIEYCNRRSNEHQDYMRYCEECRIALEEARQRRLMQQQTPPVKIFIK